MYASGSASHELRNRWRPISEAVLPGDPAGLPQCGDAPASDKLHDLRQEVVNWQLRKAATKQQVLYLIGRLTHATKVVTLGTILHKKDYYTINSEIVIVDIFFAVA